MTKKMIRVLLIACVWFTLFGCSIDKTSKATEESAGKWVTAWYAPPEAPLNTGISKSGFVNQTIRMIVHPHMEGKKLRIHLTNEFGAQDVALQAIHVAISANGASTSIGTDHTVTFEGKQTVVLPKGGTLTSDVIPLRLKKNQNLVVSLYVKQPSGNVTWHRYSMQDTYVATGNHVSDHLSTAFGKTYQEWFWLSGVDVQAASSVKGTIAVIGDSMVNGNHSTPNANLRWTDDLARRLNEDMPNTWSVVSSGISGNRLLSQPPEKGLKAANRIQRDAFNLTGIKAIIISEGMNDIRHANASNGPISNQIIAEMKQLISGGHKRGLKVYGATLTPFKGENLYSQTGEETREAVNHWIRTSHEFDGVIDFDKAVRDPKHPKQYRSDYQAGDHFHPNDKGYQAMADAINLTLFNK
ncbi:SGNH/GDSL hydrolase family protein [Pullulanibacillus sp. KACC 23026]|uniref:SGNH/GDSL hydrolase family protein n=1 Tax=Pullulanibacillus sp. KACC 23026 TaxID=3028315 RepID=UPI0023AF10FD|nr:SGNH/GDSL hydrolase family protein [Pullulanibacillus sp. KACC 23026]WEG14675.1 SGNH/GDSL hydrolase family protein [Pullulanibacillus sp. KACC 23026]